MMMMEGRGGVYLSVFYGVGPVVSYKTHGPFSCRLRTGHSYSLFPPQVFQPGLRSHATMRSF